MHENLVGKSPMDIIKKGVALAFVPEDRLGMGLVAGMDVVDNMLLKSYRGGKGTICRPTRRRVRWPSRLLRSSRSSRPDVTAPVRRHFRRQCAESSRRA